MRDKLKTAKKLKAHADFSHFAKDWDGTGVPKVKIRVPTQDGRKEFLLEPGQVIKTKDPIAERNLRLWKPSGVMKVNGQPWIPGGACFEDAATNASVHVDLDVVDVKKKTLYADVK